jgi:hypothetical protein
MPTLLIFVDSLPHNIAQKFISSIGPDYTCSEVIPGAGFSNNIYAEIVTGLGPDEIGYFNEWELKLGNISISFINKILSFFDPMRNFVYLNAGFRRIILKRILKINTFNIPFKYLHFFKSGDSHNFRDIKHGNILHKNAFEIYDSAEISARVGQRDKIAFDKAMESITNKNTLLSLVDLDNIAHIYGMKSSEYEEHLKYLQVNIVDLISKFKAYSQLNKIVLFSDHGMVPVTHGVKFTLEDKFGPVSQDTYIYFVDSTYVRIWSSDKGKLQEISNYLTDVEFGHVVGDAERQLFGFVSKEFGDLIFRANEGIMFAPNFFGARVCKAMHGYSPALKSQAAFFSCCDVASGHLACMPKTTKKIHDALLKIV